MGQNLFRVWNDAVLQCRGGVWFFGDFCTILVVSVVLLASICSIVNNTYQSQSSRLEEAAQTILLLDSRPSLDEARPSECRCWLTVVLGMLSCSPTSGAVIRGLAFRRALISLLLTSLCRREWAASSTWKSSERNFENRFWHARSSAYLAMGFHRSLCFLEII